MNLITLCNLLQFGFPQHFFMEYGSFIFTLYQHMNFFSYSTQFDYSDSTVDGLLDYFQFLLLDFSSFAAKNTLVMSSGALPRIFL